MAECARLQDRPNPVFLLAAQQGKWTSMPPRDFPELVLQGPCCTQSAPQPFFGSSRNAPPVTLPDEKTLPDDTKNGCEADYVNPFLTKLIRCSRYGLVLFAFLLMSTSSRLYLYLGHGQ